ncbi:uncharacterized protein LOC110696915 isoform X2 [Chenopodium quinoa]|nr:uncharacterized protein LOC110696915 isoform X2 [Chenopodium quinoa]
MDSSSKYKLFERGLTSYKKKKRPADALELVAKRLVKCLEGTSVDVGAVHVDVDTIFNIFTSVFPNLDVPVRREDRLEYVVDNLISYNLVQAALSLTTTTCPAEYKFPFLELQMRVHHNQGNMEEFWKIAREWKVKKLFAYAETAYIMGTSMMDSGKLQESIPYFTKGLDLAEGNRKQSLVEKIQNMLDKVKRMKDERELAPHEAVPEIQDDIQSAAQEATQLLVQQQEAEKAERNAKKLLAEEDARIVVEPKRKAKKKGKSKGKQILVVKKAVEVEDESDGMVLEEQKEEKESGSKLVEERRSRMFEMTLYVTMEELDEKSCMGSTKINTTEVRKSFIEAEQSHIDNIQELVQLCLTHENFLKIDQSFKIVEDDRRMLLTSEEVCSIECFFKRKLSELPPQSQESVEAWWDAIKDVFWKVFRWIFF